MQSDLDSKPRTGWGWTVATAVVLCAIFAFIYNHTQDAYERRLDVKDDTIELKQADIDSAAAENESLRRRLQGDVVLVSTNDLQSVRQDVASIETSLSAKLESLAYSLSELEEIKDTLDTSLHRTTPKDVAALRRAANIRPNGRSVNWMGDRESGTGMVSSSPSSIFKSLISAFKALHEGKTQESKDLLQGIIQEEPLWPYSYLYLGLNALNTATFDRGQFEKAIAAFQKYRAVGITEPEHLLHEAMCHTFLGQYEQSSRLLEDLSAFKSAPDDVVIIAVNAASPKQLLDKFRGVADRVGVKVSVLALP